MLDMYHKALLQHILLLLMGINIPNYMIMMELMNSLGH